MVHEILHRFGAVDVYDTGLHFGVQSSRAEALAIDPRTDESIMGTELRPSCMDAENGKVDTIEKDGNKCTLEEIERIYVDKLNQQKIGLD
jgi:hypothetical protein